MPNVNVRSIDNHARREEIRGFDLDSYQVLDTPPEQSFDDLVRLASLVCAAPIALITLIDSAREWFKARLGTDLHELPRHLSLSARAIENPLDVTVVEDIAAHPEFSQNAFTHLSPGVRFYAGAPLVTPVGCALGTICVMDYCPRSISPNQISALKALARQVVSQLELRRLVNDSSGNGRQHSRQNRTPALRGDRPNDVDPKLNKVFTRDELTKLVDRRTFDRILEEAVINATKRSESLSLILIDVDHFKDVNDELGRTNGDKLLSELAQRLQEAARRGDLVSRYDDDTFAVACPAISESLAYTVAQRFRLAVQGVVCNGRMLTASAGVAGLCVDALTAVEMIEAADKALYTAKRTGRDKVVRYSARGADSLTQS